MIPSGSLVPGVSAAMFELVRGTALRVELPAEDLRPYISSYHVLDSDPAVRWGVRPWALPAWPMVRFILAEQPMSLRIGTRLYDPLPSAALYGTTTRAMQLQTFGGVTVGAELTALGWSRFFRARADSHRDEIVALSEHMPRVAIEHVMAELRGSDQALQVPAILDSFFRSQLRAPSADEEAIAAIARLINDDEIDDLATLCDRAGMRSTRLRALSTRYFGFPPKTLLLRARLTRSIVRMLLAGGEPDYSLAAPTYFDTSHLLRDAHRFLGMTPRQFLQHDHSYLISRLKARQALAAAARRLDAAAEHAPMLGVAGA